MNDNEIKNKLEQPFAASVVRTRPGPHGKTLSYVPVTEYVRRLNDVFGAAWSFEIMRRDIIGDQIVVDGRLTVGDHIKCGIGGAVLTKHRDGGELVSLADDIKGAVSDALKRCCRLLGVGLELYADDAVAPDKMDGRQQSQAPRNGNNEPKGRITQAQLAKLQELAAEAKMDWRNFRDLARSRHGINIEYADRSLASRIIGDLIAHNRKARSNGRSRDHVQGSGRW